MAFLSKQQFINVCQMQDALNIKAAGVDWKEQNLGWDTAVFTEAAEAMNHLGWEWWKKPTPNLDQARLEVIDILHFAVSGLLVNSTDDLSDLHDQIENAVTNMKPEQVSELLSWNSIDCLKEIALNSVVNNFGFAVYLAVQTAATLGLNENEVYDMYVGKNVLNQFRKANGYKEGTYIKMWFGKEDNEYLTAVMGEYSNEGITPTPGQLTDRLYETYNAVKVAQH